MNVDLRVLVRLLFAILLVSLLSTMFLGKYIHKQIMETVKGRNIKPKDIISEIPLENSTKSSTNILITTEEGIPLNTLSPESFEALKIDQSHVFRLPVQEAARRDWYNRVRMVQEWHRKGIGEKGEPVRAWDPTLLAEAKTLRGLHGFHAQISDRISVNRSLPSSVSKYCYQIKYLAKLPNATVVIAFHNEHFSVLLRSIHSLVNRSPGELLREIILVDDASKLPDLGQRLDNYVAQHFGKTVTVVRLPEREGLIRARLVGAKRASGQVLVFLDSHIEVNHNWLPPLLEPIAIHRTIVTGSILDEISRETFGYQATAQLTRAGFNWRLHVKHLPPFPEDANREPSPYRTPLLVGSMAIDRSYFWQLGGYDKELDIWGGEHLEMSFKIWMCGGMLLYVPCSRVGHISRGPVHERPNPRKYNFLARNYKRVAEVWMDDYKKFVYERNVELFQDVDPGNLTAVKAQRKQLQCKSFDWYMTQVAPDFLLKFPTLEPPPLASGVIQSMAYPAFCMDTLQREHNQPLALARCSDPPGKYQDWALTQDHEIRLKTGTACLEEPGKQDKDSVVTLYHCHSLGGNQFWYYNRRWNWFQQGQSWIRCLEAIPPSGNEPGRVVSNICNKRNRKQEWHFGGL